MDNINSFLEEKEEVKEKPSKMPQRFRLEDKLYLLGFGEGLSLKSRVAGFDRFLNRYKNNWDELESLCEKVGSNPEIENKGAYLRKVMLDKY